MKKILVLILACGSVGFGDAKESEEIIKKLFYRMKIVHTKPLTVVFNPPMGHHFNLKAPSQVILKSGKTSVTAKLDIGTQNIEAKWNSAYSDCEISTELFICDDKDTYCVPKKQKFSCSGDLKAQGPQEEAVVKQAATQESIKSRVFILNDAAQAFRIAKTENKPLMIDFFGIWCPPCNMLDETVFISPQFQEFKNNFVFLKLDADKSTSWELKSKYNIKGYPTIIFARNDGEEISRIVGSRKTKAFVKEMKKALKNKNISFAEKQEMANGEKNPQAAYEMGLHYLDNEDFAHAHFYLVKASRSWTANDLRRNQLLSAQLGVHSLLPDKTSYVEFLNSAIDWYPHSTLTVERAQQMAKVAAEIPDKKLEDAANGYVVTSAKWLLKFPKNLEDEEWTKADLWEAMGESYESLKDEQHSKESYGKAAVEYAVMIKESGLDERVERGFNLERIYCLWKSGQVEKAHDLYLSLETVYPEEFTFFYQHAHLLKEQKKFKDALEKAEHAFKYSYGDNRLRVTGLMAELDRELGEKIVGRKLIDDVVAQAEIPKDQSIRTIKYIEKLKKIRETLK